MFMDFRGGLGGECRVHEVVASPVGLGDVSPKHLRIILTVNYVSSVGSVLKMFIK